MLCHYYHKEIQTFTCNLFFVIHIILIDYKFNNLGDVFRGQNDTHTFTCAQGKLEFSEMEELESEVGLRLFARLPLCVCACLALCVWACHCVYVCARLLACPCMCVRACLTPPR